MSTAKEGPAIPVVVPRRRQAFRPFVPALVIGVPFVLAATASLLFSPDATWGGVSLLASIGVLAVGLVRSAAWVLIAWSHRIYVRGDDLAVVKYFMEHRIAWSDVVRVRTYEASPRPEWSRAASFTK